MIYIGTESNIRPQTVLIEELPGGNRLVRLADNIEELKDETGAAFYRYDESVFMTTDATLTAEGIESDFAKYWAMGEEESEEDTPSEDTPLTPEELTAAVGELGDHLEMIEECLLEISEIVYE